ncbi:hypothetical protein B0H19DRAFT_231795 [Mycena capillaripes]|nr:hypothetical protein B0H19DRAFT_231795 [Mycena capillaripes]
MKNVAPTEVLIENGAAHDTLRRANIPSEQNQFQFNGNVAGHWWKALLILFEELVACCLEDLSQETVAAFAGLSSTIHQLLQSLPTAFWAIPSLGVHLKKVRKVGAPVPGTAPLAETEGVESEEEDLLAADKPLASTVDGECILFHRAVNALCAWTTGLNYLLQQPFSQSPIPLHLSVIELRRRPINAVSANELLKYWDGRCTWTKDVAVQRIVQSFQSKDPSVRTGACHCEAGLMASLVARANPDEQSVQEPPILSSSVGWLATTVRISVLTCGIQISPPDPASNRHSSHWSRQ